MSQSKRILVLGQIWPEAAASAASTRLLDLIDAFQAAGYSVTVSADGKENSATEALRQRGIDCERLAPNDSQFDQWVKDLDPLVTLFDRFTTEEKFSWRVRAACPDSLRILDTIDLHFLRLAREKAFRSQGLTSLSWQEVLHFSGDLAARETAAIYRSDLSLIVSDAEARLLVDHCGIPYDRLQLCRLLYPDPLAPPTFAERQNFSMIGNFKHPPNVDAVLFLRGELWPLIRQRLPQAKVEVWGAHASTQHLAWNDPASGFYVKGYCPDSLAMLQKTRVNLAPLRYGAGIKGKIADGWWAGTPAVTMPVGAEGMHEKLPFAGHIAVDAADFAAAAVRLHEEATSWQHASEAGLDLIRSLYSAEATTIPLLRKISWLLEHRDTMRLNNFTGTILWQQGLRSTEYFSRWIEAKNQK